MEVHKYLRVDPYASFPIATQLSQQLAWLIASGQIKEGDRLPAIRDLADNLEINFHTVRAAYQQLEAGGLVATRRGARATILPYDRQNLAASTPDLPTFTLGVFIPNYGSYYAPFLQGLKDAVQDSPWLLFICDTHSYSRHVARYMDQLVAKNVDGIIVTHFETPYISELKAILSPSDDLPPIVYADSPGMDGPGVMFDREDGSFQATNHLLYEHGHRRIGLVTPPIEWSCPNAVFRGYERALILAGLPVLPELIAIGSSFSLEAGVQAAGQLLALPEPPTAILATGDILAVGAMQAIKERGLHIPNDIAVVGYGEIDLAALVSPPLTTVSLPPHEMGVQAMTILRQLIAGETVYASRYTIDTHLIIRQSCGCGL